MSKQHKPKGGAADYKRGYANGVRAAVDALLNDLTALGRLDWVEIDEATRTSKVCIGCMLTDQEFRQLAERWKFTMGIEC